MGVRIHEFFGVQPGTAGWHEATISKQCPFVGGTCRKQLHNSEPSGVCTLTALTDTSPVICCPYRLYAEDYLVLRKIADQAFGKGIQLLSPGSPLVRNQPAVRIFGKEVNGELRLPTVDGKGSYWVDWILALVDGVGQLQEFVAVEIQTIDTTGNYRKERQELLNGNSHPDHSGEAGFNWENVNKRILPQLIYKGHVLRRESLCRKGLFFVCPTKVYEKAMARLGGKLLSYTLQAGTITFQHYGLGKTGSPLPLLSGKAFTTTVDQLAMAFSAPGNLPEQGVYEGALRTVLNALPLISPI